MSPQKDAVWDSYQGRTLRALGLGPSDEELQAEARPGVYRQVADIINRIGGAARPQTYTEQGQAEAEARLAEAQDTLERTKTARAKANPNERRRGGAKSGAGWVKLGMEKDAKLASIQSSGSGGQPDPEPRLGLGGTDEMTLPDDLRVMGPTEEGALDASIRNDRIDSLLARVKDSFADPPEVEMAKRQQRERNMRLTNALVERLGKDETGSATASKHPKREKVMAILGAAGRGYLQGRSQTDIGAQRLLRDLYQSDAAKASARSSGEAGDSRKFMESMQVMKLMNDMDNQYIQGMGDNRMQQQAMMGVLGPIMAGEAAGFAPQTPEQAARLEGMDLANQIAMQTLEDLKVKAARGEQMRVDGQTAAQLIDLLAAFPHMEAEIRPFLDAAKTNMPAAAGEAQMMNSLLQSLSGLEAGLRGAGGS